MADEHRRRRPRRSRPAPPEEADRIHREMLEHLDQHPPARSEEPPDRAGRPKRRRRVKPDGAAGPATPERPRLMLRRLRLQLALQRLEDFLRFHRARGASEVVVVVGRGRGSGEEGPVLGPAVRAFCARRADLVRDLRVATPSEGGEGALVLTLVRAAG